MAHPREGWQGHGVPRKLSRRSFLGAAGGALAVLGAAPLLSGCASALAGTGTVRLPRPNNPVKWPVFPGNATIASNLPAERDATLQIYTWVAYINQACVNAFAKKYKCKVQVTTFNTMNEALSKLRSGLSYDLLIGATVDTLGQLIESQLVQPLNHSYIPNITQAWPDFTNPFYDQGWQYTVPYTIYTTGISWRKDLVDENPYAMANPWAMPWQAKYKGRVAILDDYRESISLGLMKNGIFDLNTTDYNQIATARQALKELTSLVNVRIDNNDYTEVPDGDTWIHHAWSGDMAAAESYMPKGVPVSDVGYWFPTDGKGPVANDTQPDLEVSDQPGARPHVPQLHAGSAERLGEHQLQRLHAAIERRDPAGPGQGADPAAVAAVHGGAPVVLPPRRGRTAAARRRRCAVAAGLARREQRNLKDNR